MPYERPSLTDLRGQIAADVSAGLGGADALLRFSNLYVLGQALAGLAHLHFGYIDWVARQAIPATCSDEFLEQWAGLKGILRKPATGAVGKVKVMGAPGSTVYGSTILVRGDGAEFTVTTGKAIGGAGWVEVDARSNGVGATTNCDAGTIMTLGSALPGVQPQAQVSQSFVGGADTESDDDLRGRMLAAYRRPAQGGNLSDYVLWATSVPGVTRAWVRTNGFGAGSAVVYVMLDDAQAANGGFPQGTDGVAAAETRGTAATGDQLLVANALFELRPVTALVVVVCPIAFEIDLEVSNLSGASSSLRAQIAAAVTDVLYQDASVGGSINPDTNTAYTSVALSNIEAAVAAIPGTEGFIIENPRHNLTPPTGHLPVLGTITYL